MIEKIKVIIWDTPTFVPRIVTSLAGRNVGNVPRVDAEGELRHRLDHEKQADGARHLQGQVLLGQLLREGLQQPPHDEREHDQANRQADRQWQVVLAAEREVQVDADAGHRAVGE